MECLQCYTINGLSATPGIAVDAFESIIAEPDVDTVDLATLQTVPLFDSTVVGNDFKAITQCSLCFVTNNTDKKIRPAKTGVLIAADPEEWMLVTDNENISIIDPCGLRGHILLYTDTTMKDLLVSTKDARMCLRIDDNNKPVMHRTNRASRMLEALDDLVYAMPVPPAVFPRGARKKLATR